MVSSICIFQSFIGVVGKITPGEGRKIIGALGGIRSKNVKNRKHVDLAFLHVRREHVDLRGNRRKSQKVP